MDNKLYKVVILSIHALIASFAMVFGYDAYISGEKLAAIIFFAATFLNVFLAFSEANKCEN